LEGWPPQADGVVLEKYETLLFVSEDLDHPVLRALFQRRGIRKIKTLG
jgi:hypothetical protein